MADDFGETPKGLRAQILNLGTILTRPGALKVPRYQRPYTWTEREVRQLIQDLRAAAERDASYYFIGQIVFVRNERGEYEISDGQQRLTTLTMIIAYARDRIPSRAALFQTLLIDAKKQSPRLLVREEDASFFRGYVQESGQMAQMALLDETGSDSKDAMIVAARTIAAELREMRDRDLEALVLYVAGRATFNVVDAAERGCAATVFNTLNGRGQELSAADNIKCDLLENSKLREEEASAAARKWEELEDSLGRVRFGKLLNMMPFLLTGEQFNSPGDLAAFRAQVERGGGVRTFLFDKLPRYAAALRDILDGAVDVGGADSEVRATINADINRRLAMMKLIEEWHWAPAALAFLAEHRKPQNAKRFFQALDAFSFACAISGEIINHKNREKRWIEAAKHADEIEHVLSPEVLGMKDDERTRLIARFNLAKPKDLMRRLMLVRIEAALPGGSMLTLDDILTVEHILPARGSNPYWLALFSDKAMRESTANMLGNLTLVTRKQNEEVDCKPFPEKLDVYFNTPGALIHALTRPLKELKEWTRDEIEGRQDDMIYSLLVDWGLAKKGG